MGQILYIKDHPKKVSEDMKDEEFGSGVVGWLLATVFWLFSYAVFFDSPQVPLEAIEMAQVACEPNGGLYSINNETSTVHLPLTWTARCKNGLSISGVAEHKPQ